MTIALAANKIGTSFMTDTWWLMSFISESEELTNFYINKISFTNEIHIKADTKSGNASSAVRQE